MAFQCFYKRGSQSKSSVNDDVHPAVDISLEDIVLSTNWDEVMCPICLDHPHNGVLLQCSSYQKGCRPFVCDTNHLQSNCLERFKTANGMSPESKISSVSYADFLEILQSHSIVSESDVKPSCPLCRGEVNGWVIIKTARLHLDQKKRCCQEEKCPFTGTFLELQKHAETKHPDSRPSKIDPARQLDWENFQQSSEMVDVLSTIHSEVPRGVVLGDYVIEYGDDDTTDEFEDFPGDDGNWWTSCILYQVFDNIRSSRQRRRSRANSTRRGNRRSSLDTSNSDDGSVTSVEFVDYREEDTDDEFMNHRGPSGNISGRSSSRRRHSRFNGC